EACACECPERDLERRQGALTLNGAALECGECARVLLGDRADSRDELAYPFLPVARTSRQVGLGDEQRDDPVDDRVERRNMVVERRDVDAELRGEASEGDGVEA